VAFLVSIKDRVQDSEIKDKRLTLEGMAGRAK
jgi:hypothetical protein